ncbi:MAG: alpha/beta fold hydrolase [Chloroflexota bacterium]
MTNPVTLHYSEQGIGTPVVLLHGFPFSSAIWQTQQQGLSNDYRVIALDLRGHGASPAPEGTYDMETMAQDVLTLLDSLDVERAAIIGHSMGGYVTLALWRLAPERFSALGLISSQASADSDEARKNRYKTAEKVFIEGSSAVAQAMLPKLFAPHTPDDETFIEQVNTLILNTRPSGIIGTLKGMAARPDSTDLLPHINIPVLILTGDHDQLIAPQKADAMAALIPTATLVSVENAGHMPMLEQPQAVLLAMRNFLNEVKNEVK